MIFVKDQETKMSQAFDQTSQTPSMLQNTRSKEKDGSSEAVTNVVPIRVIPGCVPTKKRTNTMAGKKAKPSHVSETSHHYVSAELPTRKPKKVASHFCFKKRHSMTSLYGNPLSTPNVKFNVGTPNEHPLESNGL